MLQHAVSSHSGQSNAVDSDGAVRFHSCLRFLCVFTFISAWQGLKIGTGFGNSHSGFEYSCSLRAKSLANISGVVGDLCGYGFWQMYIFWNSFYDFVVCASDQSWAVGYFLSFKLGRKEEGMHCSLDVKSLIKILSLLLNPFPDNAHLSTIPTPTKILPSQIFSVG